MSEFNDDQENRKQNRLEKLGTNKPACPTCSETDWRCFELHHVAGKRYDDTVTLLCKNCHAKVSDSQKDHPKPLAGSPSQLERIGHFLLGLAELLGLAAVKLKEFGLALIQEARKALGQSEEVRS